MITVWGICEYGEPTHDPLRRWDFTCTFFIPLERKRIEDRDVCCGNCRFWLAPDEHLEGKTR
jgi:hypothetical protein